MLGSYTTLRRPTTQPGTIVLFTPADVRKLRNPAFGFGLAPAREKRAPYSLADLEWLAANTPADPTAPSEGECFDRACYQTMSRSEYAAFRAEARAAELDRYSRCEQAEIVENGAESFADDLLDALDDATLDALAAEAHEMDRLCGYDFTPAESPAPARKPRRKVETLRTRRRAARKAAAETPLDALGTDALIAEFVRLYGLLPARDIGWTTEQAAEADPAIGRRMAAINAILAIR
jgi:hypothetical protein